MPQDRLKATGDDLTSSFDYRLGDDGLRVSLRGRLLCAVPYGDIERVEKGWAPGWEVGGRGMPFRGDEVRIRVRGHVGLPWMTVTPAEPDRFVERLSGRALEAGVPASRAAGGRFRPPPVRSSPVEDQPRPA
jgi:hypothetical protein